MAKQIGGAKTDIQKAIFLEKHGLIILKDEFMNNGMLLGLGIGQLHRGYCLKLSIQGEENVRMLLSPSRHVFSMLVINMMKRPIGQFLRNILQ